MNSLKFLLAALNTKYIHSNPGIYSLYSYSVKKQPSLAEYIEIAEYTINNQKGEILADIYKRRPDAVGFSCYIWNIEMIRELITELKKLLPDTDIWVGGPEVTYDADQLLAEMPELTGVMVGEGEATFYDVLRRYLDIGNIHNTGKSYDIGNAYNTGNSCGIENFRDTGGFRDIDGLVLREGKDILCTKPRGLTDLSELPFLYYDLDTFKNKIIYYESSRGCPFRCSYCLSSIDKRVRFRNLDLVKKELQFFLDHQVKQVKFVDRTFNCSHEHAMAIWRYIKEHDNGITNFHFEIAADILNEEELELVNSLRPGAIQMEIGVQSTNLQTIEEIDRVMDVDKLAKIVERIHQGHNVHVHLDLIAGLPYEDYESFAHSFNDVYAMKPEQLQLGFLKVLKGSKMHDNAERYGLQYTSCPPYEVLFTKWISYDEILRLKQIEEMVEIYYNSCQFENTLPFLVEEFDSPFDFYASLASYYDEKGYFIQTPARIYRYHVLLHFAEEHFPKKTELIRQMLIFDLYLRENMKTRPDFAPEQEGVRDLFRDFYIREANDHRYLREEDYHGCDWKSMSRMTHIEKIYYNRETGNRLSEVCYILFDYKRRDPLTGDARYMIVTPVASM